MEERVEAFIIKHQLIQDGDTIVVGLSGGPDSLALLHYLWKLREKRRLKLIAAHLNHRFRGVEAEEDCLYVKHFCESNGIYIVADSIDVPAYQKKHRLNAQQAARECRYRFYEEVMKRFGANKLALGHHGDDQVETIVMKITRGNLEGIKGMPVKRSFATGEIIRPFLALSKQQIEAYCEREDLHPRYDSSNKKEGYTRNRFRKHLLPFLKNENPKVHEHMQYMSEVLNDEAKLLDRLAMEKVSRALIEKSRDTYVLDINVFKIVPVPLQRRGIHLILKYLYGNKLGQYSSVHIEGILRLVRSEHPSGYMVLPNQLRIIRTYNRCILTYNDEAPEGFTYELSVPGIIENNHFVIEAFTHPNTPSFENVDDFIRLSLEGIIMPLVIRTRLPGDRMEVFTNGQTKKVNRIFIDEKVPKLMRDSWPVVTDQSGRILWIPAVKKSVQSTPSKTTDEVVLTFRKNDAIVFDTP